jgi:RimJ/RimL family protein N-acetyltransferase
MLLPDLAIRCWRPDVDGFPKRGSRSLANLFWWVLAKSGSFPRPGFCELSIRREGRLLHRLVVTPRWYRFPFMAARDLQVGSVWTAPAARQQGVARKAIAEAHRRFAGEPVPFWYVTDAANSASAALARACGYELVATGRRTRRFGSRLLGQFVIERWVHAGEIDTEATAPDCSEASGAGRTLRVSH